MTLLDTIIANSLDTTTAGASLYTTAQTVDSDDALSTTVVSAITTVLDSIEVPNIYVTRELTTYVETMPEEELIQGLELLDQKERELTEIEALATEKTPVDTAVKTLKIGQKQQ